jgi:sulfate adenylyltransferase subunit 2
MNANPLTFKSITKNMSISVNEASDIQREISERSAPDYLDQLEAEAIYIMREVAGQFERPALLFSGGKDSITLVHLARKAFAPGKIPFPLVHVTTLSRRSSTATGWPSRSMRN